MPLSSYAIVWQADLSAVLIRAQRMLEDNKAGQQIRICIATQAVLAVLKHPVLISIFRAERQGNLKCDGIVVSSILG